MRVLLGSFLGEEVDVKACSSFADFLRKCFLRRDWPEGVRLMIWEDRMFPYWSTEGSARSEGLGREDSEEDKGAELGGEGEASGWDILRRMDDSAWS